MAPHRRLPAEWEPHRCVWVAWPHNESTWPGLRDRVETAFARLVRTLRRFEEVRLIASSEEAVHALRARTDLGAGRPLTLVEIPTDDAWVRDTGPLFVWEGNELLATCWRFDAWGRKYPPWERDAAVARRLAAWSGHAREDIDRVLEGGSVDSDGEGTLITTESCLLRAGRDPDWSRDGVESLLRDRLGVERVLWLGEGIAGDDTDGHVDTICRFVAPGVVVAAVEEDPADPNHAPLRENRERLRALRDAAGRRLRIVELPLPAPVVHRGERLPASYANFYIARGGVVVPTFRDPNDARALAILREVFPGRQVVGVDCRELVVGLGGVHCLTREEPLAAPRDAP